MTSERTIFNEFVFNDPATTEIYTLSLHDALPILQSNIRAGRRSCGMDRKAWGQTALISQSRSEEHTSELQSHHDRACRLLLEKTTAPRRCFCALPRTLAACLRTHLCLTP